MPRLAVEHRGCRAWGSLCSWRFPPPRSGCLLHACRGRPWVVPTPELCGELPGILPVGFSETDAKDYVNSLYRIGFQCPGTSPGGL